MYRYPSILFQYAMPLQRETSFLRMMLMEISLRRTDTSQAVVITPVLHSYLPLSFAGSKFFTTNLRTLP